MESFYSLFLESTGNGFDVFGKLISLTDNLLIIILIFAIVRLYKMYKEKDDYATQLSAKVIEAVVLFNRVDSDELNSNMRKIVDANKTASEELKLLRVEIKDLLNEMKRRG